MNERLILWHRWFPPKREDPSAHASVAAWQRSVATRFSVAGGELLGAIGGTVVAGFDLGDATDAIDMALDLLAEAELEVAIGAAVGEVTFEHGAATGSAMERAQLLVNRTRGGELVLDARARALAAADFLLGRQVGAGAGAARGTTVDRRHPRRSECAEAIATLASPPLPPIIDSLRQEIEAELTAGGARTFVLRGPVGAGATELVRTLERTLEPQRVLGIGASPGGVVPLASLRLALLRRLETPERVASAFGGETGAVFARVAAGELVPSPELARALAALANASPDRPWVVLNPLSLVDGATLAALLEARALGADFVLFGRFPVESPLPRPLLELTEPVLEHTLPPLKTADARVVAEAILGHDTADDVARRVAVLGGDTVLGVVEAARTLIATGELVREGEGFVWRMGPRHGANAISTEELISERLELLDPASRRVLEALCVVPDGWPPERLASVAGRDGVGEKAFAKSLARLIREALATGSVHPRPASSLLRWRILNRIPPARFTELHRFVGEVLAEERPSSPPLAAELGYYAFEGAREAEARPHLLGAMEALVGSGYERSARQLAGWMAQRGEERARSSASGPTPPPPRPELFEEPPPSSEYLLDEVIEDAEAEAAPAPKKKMPPPPKRPLASGSAASQQSASAAPREERAAGSTSGSGDDARPGRPVEDAPVAGPRKKPPPPPASLRTASATTDSAPKEPPPPATSMDSLPAIGASIDDALTDLEPDGAHSLSGFFGLVTEDAGDAVQEPPALAIDEELDALLEESAPQDAQQIDEELDALLEAPLDADAGFPDERTSVSPAPARPFVHDALRAIRERDFVALEQAIRRAVAEGSDLGAVARVRAVAELARGDLDAARRSLHEARAQGRGDGAAQARHHLSEALLELHDGDPLMGVRAGLAALASSRRLGDGRGEAAALHTLAACYRALGQDALALRLVR